MRDAGCGVPRVGWGPTLGLMGEAPPPVLSSAGITSQR